MRKGCRKRRDWRGDKDGGDDVELVADHKDKGHQRAIA